MMIIHFRPAPNSMQLYLEEAHGWQEHEKAFHERVSAAEKRQAPNRPGAVSQSFLDVGKNKLCDLRRGSIEIECRALINEGLSIKNVPMVA